MAYIAEMQCYYFRGQFSSIYFLDISFSLLSLCDLVHDVETIFLICGVLTAAGNLFLKYDAWFCIFLKIISDIVFQMLLAETTKIIL